MKEYFYLRILEFPIFYTKKQRANFLTYTERTILLKDLKFYWIQIWK